MKQANNIFSNNSPRRDRTIRCDASIANPVWGFFNYPKPQTIMETLTNEQHTPKGQLVHLGKGVKAGIMNITPEQAEKMLERNPHNRGIKKGRISQFAMDMEDGLWHMNGVPIIFNHKGELLDGQNRLHAIIRAGISIEAVVITGITQEAFQTIDTGSRRTGADVLTIYGLSTTKARKLAPLLRKINYETIGYKGSAWSANSGVYTAHTYVSVRDYLTNQLMVEFYINNQQEIDDVYDFCIQHDKKVRKVISFPLYMLAFYNLRKINLKEAESFCEKLATGNIAEPDSPVYLLREKLLHLKNSMTDKVPSWHYPALIYKAWNYYRRRKPLVKLYISVNEKEPVKPI